MPAAADPRYDLRQALQSFAPGVLPTREIDNALAVQYAANNFTPLTQGQVLAIVGPLPTYPTGLPRFPDSNPATDGWSLGSGRRSALG